MKIIVKEHNCEIAKEPINEKEINVTKCEFEFVDSIPSDYVKEAYFTYNGVTYKEIIVNDECDIPSEVLNKKGQVELGVVAYKIEDDEYIKRYNPSPVYFETWLGSLKEEVENSTAPTPSELEQIQSILTNKQDKLVNGVSIKTINGQSVLGEGNIDIEGGSGTPTDVQINGTSVTSSGVANILTNGTYNSSTNKIATMSDIPDINGKQDTLVSGTNIKTINGSSILGSGNINISGGEAISVGNIQFDLVEESE